MYDFFFFFLDGCPLRYSDFMKQFSLFAFASSASHTLDRVSVRRFYNEYHGHRKQDLELLFTNLRIIKGLAGTDDSSSSSSASSSSSSCPINSSNHSFVWLVGDSSLDNKYWVHGDKVKACNGYEYALNQSDQSTADVAHWMNVKFDEYHHRQTVTNQSSTNPRNGSNCNAINDQQQQQRPHFYTCINCSVEESTVGERENGRLFPQDEFVRDHMSPNDILVVSLGGNDIALKPSAGTIFAMAWLSKFSRTSNVVDGSAWGLDHFHSLLHEKYQEYLKNITSKCKPKLIVPCMIYHLDENPKSASWANLTLDMIGYNKNPKHVQAIIHRLFVDCMVNNPLEVAGVRKIHPIELSRALDGTDPRDYDNRVEPSSQGGMKMASLISSEIFAQVANIEKEDDELAARRRQRDQS